MTRLIIAIVFAVSPLAPGFNDEEATAQMFNGNIRTMDIADAAAWLVRVAMAMKVQAKAQPVA